MIPDNYEVFEATLDKTAPPSDGRKRYNRFGLTPMGIGSRPITLPRTSNRPWAVGFTPTCTERKGTNGMPGIGTIEQGNLFQIIVWRKN